MDVAETRSSFSYNKPPWLFKGSALYQLHLVKAETARSFIPKELKLVEAFGYTLGGFFLAQYDDSPAGMFDELVVIAGIVWNPPTSCAWAARVLVNSREAYLHGRKDVGLPSRVAGFSKKFTAIKEKPRNKSDDFLNRIGLLSSTSSTKKHRDIQVTEIEGSTETEFCTFKLPSRESETQPDCKWMGPAIRMSLPSFSGKTEYNPQLLKYSCQIDCRVRPVEPALVSGHLLLVNEEDRSQKNEENFSFGGQGVKSSADNDARTKSISVLLSKPVLAMEFNFLKMEVNAPTSISSSSTS